MGLNIEYVSITGSGGLLLSTSATNLQSIGSISDLK